MGPPGVLKRPSPDMLSPLRPAEVLAGLIEAQQRPDGASNRQGGTPPGQVRYQTGPSGPHRKARAPPVSEGPNQLYWSLRLATEPREAIPYLAILSLAVVE